MPAAPMPPDLPTQPAEFGAAARQTPAARTSGVWQQIGRALGWPQRTALAPIDLSEARTAFVNCLADVPTLPARTLRQRLRHAHSLSELWHLRPEVFRLLALQHSQAEAERRLAVLAQRFDRRAKPRTFTSLAPPTRPL